MEKLHTFLHDEDGQAIFEYVFLLSIALTTAVFIGKSIISVFDRGILSVGATLEKYLKTGRLPPRVWTN